MTDPCSSLPGTDIPSGIMPPTHHHIFHRVVGRIRHAGHHGMHTHLGGAARVPVINGCDKVAPGGAATKAAVLPAGPLPSAAKLIGAGKVAGIGLTTVGAIGSIGGFFGGIPGVTPPTHTPSKVTFVAYNPVPGGHVNLTPPGGLTPPVTPPDPGTPTVGPTPPSGPTPVPEPATILVFAVALLVLVIAQRLRPASARA